MQKEIYFGAGCFWGTEAFFKKVHGVLDVESGYANGSTEAPSYQDVCAGSGHAEVVKIIYDDAKIDLPKLLNYFFQIIDPTTLNQQGEDVGVQYRTGVYYVDVQDQPVIQAALDSLQNHYESPIMVENLPLAQYFPAETYHQDYLDKNPNGYCHISFALMAEILRDQDKE